MGNEVLWLLTRSTRTSIKIFSFLFSTIWNFFAVTVAPNSYEMSWHRKQFLFYIFKRVLGHPLCATVTRNSEYKSQANKCKTRILPYFCPRFQTLFPDDPSLFFSSPLHCLLPWTRNFGALFYFFFRSKSAGASWPQRRAWFHFCTSITNQMHT